MAPFGYLAPPSTGGGGISEITFTITIVNGKLHVDGQEQQSLSVLPGMSYKFDLSDSSLSANSFKLSTTADGTHGGGSAFTTGVTESGTAGTAGASLTWDVPVNVPTEMNYYDENTAGAGATTGAVDAAATGGGATSTATFNALPAASAAIGQLHYIEATKLLYYSNGQQWSLLGSNPPTLGAITANLQTLDVNSPSGGDTNWDDVTACVTGEETVTESQAGDPYYKNVSFHFNFDQDPPVDQSYYGVGDGGTRNITMRNSAAISTSVKKWGVSSLDVRGAQNMYMDEGGQLGTGNFTIEGWIYPVSLTADGYMFKSFQSGDSGCYILYNHTRNTLNAYTWYGQDHSGGNSQSYIDGTQVVGALAVDKWTYFAYERYGKNVSFTVYKDGDFVDFVQSGDVWMYTPNVTSPGNHPLRSNGNYPTVPCEEFVMGHYYIDNSSQNYPFDGYLDDWRLTAGVARYRGGVAPLPTAAFVVGTQIREETIPDTKTSKVITNRGSVVRPLGSGDPYWDAVSLYMDFNSTPFTDQSRYGWEFTGQTGNSLTSQGTAASDKFFGTGSFNYGDGTNGSANAYSGGESLYIDDAGPGYFRQNEDWTIELIHRQHRTGSTDGAYGGSGGEYQTVMAVGSAQTVAGGVPTGWTVNNSHGRLTDGQIYIKNSGTAAGTNFYNWSTGFSNRGVGGWWIYWVLERKGNMIYQHHWLLGAPTGGAASYGGMPWANSYTSDPANNLYYAGNSTAWTGELVYSNYSNDVDSTAKFSIGRRWNSYTSAWDTAGSNGFLDSVRITRGVARFNGAAPPKPIAEGSTDASLMRWPNGNKNFSAAWSGGVEHVGKGNSSIPKSSAGEDYTFGTGALTIEGWIYMSGATMESCFWDFRDPAEADTQDQLHFTTYWNPTNAKYDIKVYLANTAIITSSTSEIELERWYHIALTRLGSSPYQFELFIDATSKGTATSNTSITAGALSLGSYYKGTDTLGFTPVTTTPSDFAGFLDDFKVTKGYVRTVDSGHSDATGNPMPIAAGGITHTTGATGVAGSGTPMNTTSLAGTTANPTTDEAGAVLTYGIKDDEVTISNCQSSHSPSHNGTKTATEAGLVVNSSTGNISITSPSAWEGDTVSFEGSISDGVNSVYKTISYIVKPNFTILASSGDPVVYNVDGKTVLRFNASGTFTVSAGSGPIEYYIIGGGGSGGRMYGGGGGGGAVLTGTETVTTTGGNGGGVYTCTVGASAYGYGAGTTVGHDSSIAFGGSTGTLTANGGGRGGEHTSGSGAINPAYSGNGSGGGAYGGNSSLHHTSGTYGNDGGICAATSQNAAGGGGGAGGAGSQGGTGNVFDQWGASGSGDSQGGKGGAPVMIDWDGTSRPFAAGGGGGSYSGVNAYWSGEGAGLPVYSAEQVQYGYASGIGGGTWKHTVIGSGSWGDTGRDGEANTGSGGGGSVQGNTSTGGGSGGSGCIFIRF